ncbi:hypothetical protein BDF14DRAFT_1510892 [Spinellus fusiger]|nr:hypothetical protein BDF14DRAFT_1510892 [Spinellus fusiger]
MSNTHVDLSENLQKHEIKKRKMIEDSQLFWDYQRYQTDTHAARLIYQAEQDYLMETQSVRERLFAVLEAKRRKLKDEKDNGDLTLDVPMDTQTRPQKRNLRKRGNETAEVKSSKRKQSSGPSLIFRLTEEEIGSDLLKMRGGTASPAKKASTSAHKKK